MPMCQSPRITDALLRTSSRPPANDNCVPVQAGIKSRKPKPKHQAMAIWRAAVVLVGASLLL